MPNLTAIEWTDTTWNPVTGCTKISAGCDHCYAERFSERFRGTPGHPFESGFDLTLRAERLAQPLSWRKPRMVFVNSMSDLFHKQVPQAFISKVFDTMEKADWHTFQILTKRSSIIVEAFGESLARVGSYNYVAETTVLKPLSDRALYCLCYATRHPKGIEVFRDCQLMALREQAKTRAVTKVKHAEALTGQHEIFDSLHEMAPNELETLLASAKEAAEKTLLELTPAAPEATRYENIWPRVLAKHVVRLTDVNQIAARLRKEQKIVFPDWERGKRVPQSNYKMHKL